MQSKVSDSKDSDVDFLGSAEVFRTVPRHLLVDLVAHSRVQTISAGEKVTITGEMTEHVLVVRSGIIGLFVRYQNQFLVPCEILGPRRLLGLSAFLPRETAVTEAVAVMDVTVLSYPNRVVQKVALESPDLALAMYQDVAHMLQRQRGNLVRALAGEETSFSQEELCPSERPTHFLFSINTETQPIRGMCQRRFECSVADGRGCPMAGQAPQEFVPIWLRS